MKTTAEKRADLIKMINGKKSMTELSLESVSNLSIKGTPDRPEFWIGSRNVNDVEFYQTLDWLDKHYPGVIIDWSTENKLDVLIPVPIFDSTAK